MLHSPHVACKLSVSQLFVFADSLNELDSVLAQLSHTFGVDELSAALNIIV